MTNTVYDTLHWAIARKLARKRDANRCTVSRLLGGDCSARLDVHHIKPVSEGGPAYELENLATVCASHHPVWEALRRRLLANLTPVEEKPVRCRHYHPTAEGRRLCERRMAQRLSGRSVAA